LSRFFLFALLQCNKFIESKTGHPGYFFGSSRKSGGSFRSFLVIRKAEGLFSFPGSYLLRDTDHSQPALLDFFFAPRHISALQYKQGDNPREER
jgi:hypothetical protein